MVTESQNGTVVCLWL